MLGFRNFQVTNLVSTQTVYPAKSNLVSLIQHNSRPWDYETHALPTPPRGRWKSVTESCHRNDFLKYNIVISMKFYSNYATESEA